MMIQIHTAQGDSSRGPRLHWPGLRLSTCKPGKSVASYCLGVKADPGLESVDAGLHGHWWGNHWDLSLA